MIIRSIKIESRPWRNPVDENIILSMEINVEGDESIMTEQVIFTNDLEANFDVYLDYLFKKLREEFRAALSSKKA